LFVEQAVTEGMIGIVVTNAPSNMPPHGGRAKFFGANPLAVGIPRGAERPVLLDMSTSVVARGAWPNQPFATGNGRLLRAQRNGSPTIVLDQLNYPTAMTFSHTGDLYIAVGSRHHPSAAVI
jgi:hypothetical protein